MAMWRAAAQQTGAVLVTSIEEALDTLQVIVKLPELHGAGCGLIGGQGGQSVAIADAFAEHGLRVPPLSDASKAELGAYFKLVGASASNPIDLGMNMTDIDRTLDILEADPVIDVIGMQIGILATEERHQGMRAAHVRSIKRTAARGRKPAVAIPYSLLPYEHAEVLRETERSDAGIPCFPSYHRAELSGTPSTTTKPAAHRRRGLGLTPQAPRSWESTCDDAAANRVLAPSSHQKRGKNFRELGQTLPVSTANKPTEKSTGR